MSERWPALMDRALAAEYLNVSIATVSRIKANGGLKTVLIKGEPKFRRYDLDKFIDNLPAGNGKCNITTEAAS